jgi:signal transduction histidine kinase
MVDDVTRYQQLYEMAITDAMPAKISFATNGEEALEALASPTKYDLLILDLNMPKLGGEDTLAQIRQDPGFDNMPVIILTGDPDLDTHRRLLELGADDFIEKGSPPELFVARLKAQMRYKLALDRLTRIAVDMDIFAAGVLHDIRNLETNINAVCELTKMSLEKDPVSKKVDMLNDFGLLEEKAVGLAKYATDIIEMVRETKQQITLESVNPRKLLDWVFIMAESSEGKEPLEWSIETDLSNFQGDKNFLRLAFLNIVQNAVKYSRPESPPKVSIYERDPVDGGNDLEGKRRVICIRDYGIGVPEGEHRKVFKPFVRGTGQPKGTGFGLGLSLVHKVISTMSGRVWAEPPPDGYGTVFCIELPVAERIHVS